ncbi:MAG TPA: hypothetical protein VGM12_07190 [Trebonia sp.]
MTGRDFAPDFRLALAAKDAGPVRRAAEEYDLDLPLVEAIAALRRGRQGTRRQGLQRQVPREHTEPRLTPRSDGEGSARTGSPIRRSSTRLTRKATGGSRKTTRGRPTCAANPRARENRGKSSGGVDLYGHTKEELRKRAAELDGRGRSTMTKEQVAEAIARKQG